MSGIEHWELDFKNKNKRLTVVASDVKADDVINKLKEAGYCCELLKE